MVRSYHFASRIVWNSGEVNYQCSWWHNLKENSWKSLPFEFPWFTKTIHRSVAAMQLFHFSFDWHGSTLLSPFSFRSTRPDTFCRGDGGRERVSWRIYRTHTSVAFYTTVDKLRKTSPSTFFCSYIDKPFSESSDWLCLRNCTDRKTYSTPGILWHFLSRTPMLLLNCSAQGKFENNGTQLSVIQ